MEDRIDLAVEPSESRGITGKDSVDNHDSSASLSQDEESSINETQHNNKSDVDGSVENVENEKITGDCCSIETENKEIETETESEAVCIEGSVSETEDSQPEDTKDSLGVSKISSCGESPSKKGASKRKNQLPKMHFQQQQQKQLNTDKGRTTKKTRQTRTGKRRKKGKLGFLFR